MDTSRDCAKKSCDAGDADHRAAPEKKQLNQSITSIVAPRKKSKSPTAPLKDAALFNRLFYLNPNWTMLSTLSEGIIIAANEAFYRITGYQEHEVLGRSATSLGLWNDSRELEHLKRRIIEKQAISSELMKIRLRNGEIRDFIGTVQLIESDKELYALSVLVDITEKKVVEDALKQERQRVGELAEQLRELNTAIRVFGDAWGKEKAAIRNRVKYHINVNVLPFIEKIKTAQKKGDIHTYIKIVEENLQDLSPAFSNTRGPIMERFTPSESQIIQFVKHGQSTKEIAELLNLSTKAISFHRSNIRKKLNLVNKKVSLATFLRSQDVVP